MLTVLRSLLLGLLISACSASDPNAADTDASVAPTCTTPEQGCACEGSGAVICNGGSGIHCCGGTWRAFVDGPCHMPPDSGVDTPPDCSGGSTAAGCPCETEGEMQCGYFYKWNRVCSGGIWRTDVGHMCC